jgi:tetratricopeptide (TPR) repeat protein
MTGRRHRRSSEKLPLDGPSQPTFVEEGLRLHQAGCLDQAKALYLKVLAVKSDDADALHLLGVVHHQQGASLEAVELLTQATAIKPNYAEAYSNLGVSLAALGRLDDAVAAYRQAIAIKPGIAHWYRNLGGALAALGKFEEATTRFREAVALMPGYAEAYADLATSLKELRHFDKAAAALRQAVAIMPNVADWHSNLGMALAALGQFDEALACLRQAIEICPDNAAGHHNMAIAFKELRQFDEAVASLRRAVTLMPNNARWQSDLGAALVETGEWNEAVVCLRQAIVLRPDYPEAYDNLAFALKNRGEFDEAVVCLRQAIALRPEYADAHGHLGMLLMLLGNFREGFEEYRWRWQASGFSEKPPDVVCPLWQGENLAGKTILVHCEQGYGDSLQFARYLKPLSTIAERVWLQTDAALAKLFRSIPGIVVCTEVPGADDRLDYRVPLLCLPRLFATTLETVPNEVPYLAAARGKLDHWAERLAPYERKIKIGLVWAGDPRTDDPAANPIDQRRSVSLKQFAPLAGIAEVQFFSLQKGEPSQQASRPPVGMNLIDMTNDLLDFEDTAALISNLDLVISVDTAVAHLAGALDKPVWLLNRFDTCWRWLLNRDDSPWYPRLRQFRQPCPGDWNSVIDRVQQALQRLADGDVNQLRPNRKRSFRMNAHTAARATN